MSHDIRKKVNIIHKIKQFISNRNDWANPYMAKNTYRCGIMWKYLVKVVSVAH
jgi:hypothetical protein